MPNIDLSILNQRATPAFFADTLANRPAPSFVGRIFISTDTLDLYRDTGSAWLLLSPSSTGTITGSGAAGQVTIFSGASSITGTNNLFWDTSNLRLGINTNTPGAAIDLHSTASTLMQLNQTTATNDTRIAFQNSGTALWRIGNFYNAGANDWGIFDVVGAAQPFTIKKTTGQTFIGAETTSSGRLVVNNSTGDNHIVVIGATAPSFRINNAGTGATRQIGIGLATTTNNFIQGTTGGEMAIFNSSTTASPILFGVYDAGLSNTQEAARISASRNLLVGTTTDAGQKLQVSGTAYVTGNLGVGTSDTSTYRVNINNTMNVNGNTFLASGSGGVVIGDTTTPIGTLDIKANSPLQYFQSKVSVTSGSRGDIGWLNSLGNGCATIRALASSSDVQSTSLQFLTRDTTGSQVERLTILNSGNVGIGSVNSYLAQLNVANISSGSLRRGLSLFNNSSDVAGSGISIEFYPNVGNDDRCARISSNNTATGLYADLRFSTANASLTAEAMRITPGGNLLIGTTTDNGDKLQVTGRTISSLGFKSITGSVSIASGATATIFTMNDNALYLVQIIVTSGSIIYSAANWFLSHASNGQYVNAGGLYDGANVTLANAGADIQITNNGFGTFTWNYTILTQCF